MGRFTSELAYCNTLSESDLIVITLSVNNYHKHGRIYMWKILLCLALAGGVYWMFHAFATSMGL